MEFVKYTVFLSIIIDCFFCELTIVKSVGTDQIVLPSLIEKHLKVFSKSTTKTFPFLILICELKEDECFFPF